jgi:putative ABC transport system substrate-binding protein
VDGNREKDMKKKIIGPALCALLFALCLHAEAQQATKILKIGFLGARPASGPGAGSEAIRRSLHELGYVEGKNIVYESRYADDRLDRLPALADELVRLNVNLLLTPAPPAVLAAKNATRTIPIVFYNVADPVAGGLVDSLARPGGNITGVTTFATVLVGKQLELLKETIPKLSRVAVLWNPQDESSAQQWKESLHPARELRLQLDSMEVNTAEKYETAFKEALKTRSAAFVLTLHALANSNQKRIADLAAKNRLPGIYPRSDFVTSGGLMSYGADRAEPLRRVAVFVDKILKGAKPADIPVEQPTKFEFTINLKTAKALNLTIPQSMLFRADKVIK